MSTSGAEATADRERVAERRAAGGFVVAAVSAVALAVVYWEGGQPQLEGLFLGLVLGGICYGFVTWGNHLLPQGPSVGPREDLGSSEEERRDVEEGARRGGVVTRRTLLLRTLGLAAGGLGVAALFPIRSLGPRPGTALIETPWRAGLRLVTEAGHPVRAAEVPLGGLVTVFPEGHPRSADGQAVLIRVNEGLIRPVPGREGWSPQGLVAYSKLCTHAGCPVGLYEAATYELLCPCHQSSFDVLDRARPTFGPAAAPLPQLPLEVDGEGFVVAQGEFSEPVGPVFWRRS